MQCASCGFENLPESQFCEECGTKLVRACPSCGREARPTAKFCPACGTPLTGQSSVQRLGSSVPKASDSGPQTSDARRQTLDPRPVSYTPPHLAARIRAEGEALAARGAAAGERKTITALFADVAGFTALAHDLDPEETRAIIDPALRLMMDAVHRYEGYVAQSLGDGIFALFGAPIAHEDHPQRALYAALRMQEEMKRYADRLRLQKGVPLQIRVGINTGEVVLRSVHKDDLHTDYVPVGDSTNLASRMESLATPGSIVVSEATYKLIEGYFACKPLGAAQVKGINKTVNVYEILGVGPLRTRLQVAARRGLARFVGRQREVEQLRRAFGLAKAGHGQIVGVMGEPGVGKSRLFHEFKLLSQKDCLLLETFSVSHGKAYPYLPLIELLNNYFHLTSQDDERQRREKITGRILTLDRTLEDTLPYFFFLLGVTEPTAALQQLDPQLRRRTFDAIKQVLLRESLNQPLLLIFEDLHWLDTETQAFLNLLGESVATTRMLLLVNYRPEYQHGWGSKTYYTQLRLDPLGQEDAQELLAALLGESADLRPLKHFILEKTEGNPFFMEEMVQALIEQGVVVHDAGGARCNVPLPALKIPTTVQGVLAARIDHLSAAEKELLQTLAVIGKEFPLGLLQRVVPHTPEELQHQLFRLQEAEFIYEQPAFPEVEYTFKHALTQEVAYNSLLIERRKALHERTAQALEALFHHQLEDHYSELAHHYSHSVNTGKAAAYLRLAGQQATQRSAYAEAITQLTAALELLKTLPDTPACTRDELALQIMLGTAFMATKGYAALEAGKAYTRARELCQQTGDSLQLFPVLRGLLHFHLNQGELRSARELGEQLLSLAQDRQDSAFLLEAHYTLALTFFWSGEMVSARQQAERGIALYDRPQHHFLTFRSGEDPAVGCLTITTLALWWLGYPEQALQSSRETLTLAQELAHPFSLAWALFGAGWLHQHRGEVQSAQEFGEATLTLANEHGFLAWLEFGAILGWALTEKRHPEEGLTQLRQGLTNLRAAGQKTALTYPLALLAETHGHMEQTEEGLQVVAEALAIVDKTGERLYEAELYRLKGKLVLQSAVGSLQSENPSTQHLTPNPQAEAEAEACFHKALDMARAQQAKSWELRIAMSLTRLWQQQGKRQEAHSLLAEIYGWFTEGFDTKDLQEAQALLAALNQAP